MTFGELRAYIESFGFQVHRREGANLVDAIVAADGLGTSRLADAIREVCALEAVDAAEATGLADAVAAMSAQFAWAWPLVGDPEHLASIRAAVGERRGLRQRLNGCLCEDFDEGIRALLSATTRVLVESEKAGDLAFKRVAGEMLVFAARALAAGKIDSEVAEGIRLVFVGSKQTASKVK